MEPNQPKNQRKRKSEKPCTILKIKTYRKRDQPFTQILNDTLRDQRLGGMARAVLAYALSRPSDWQLHSWEVAKEFRCGAFAIRTAMQQLKSAGYARLDLVRAASGQVTGRVWLIRESPELEWPQPRRGFSTLGVLDVSPRRGFPNVGKTDLGKPAPLRMTDLHEEKSLTKKRVTRHASAHRVSDSSLEEFEEDERDIITHYNETLCRNGSGFKPVNRFTPAVLDALANWFATYRNSEPEDLRRLFRAVANGEECVTIPQTRTLTRLLYDNPPDTLEFPSD